MSRKKWKESEDKQVLDQKVSDAKLALRLNRSIMAVRQRRSVLRKQQLGDAYKPKSTYMNRRHWTAEEDMKVSDMSRTAKEVAEELGRTPEAVEVRRYRLRLNNGLK